MFGVWYYCLGVLKLLADLLGFAGPLLLHELVDFVDSPSEDAWRGYFYAGLLCLSTLLASVLSSQFSFQASKVQTGLRAAVVGSIYAKATNTRVGAVAAGTAGASKGMVVNMMSTDCDRIANFCQRYDLAHNAWRFPFLFASRLSA